MVKKIILSLSIAAAILCSPSAWPENNEIKLFGLIVPGKTQKADVKKFLKSKQVKQLPDNDEKDIMSKYFCDRYAGAGLGVAGLTEIVFCYDIKSNTLAKVLYRSDAAEISYEKSLNTIKTTYGAPEREGISDSNSEAVWRLADYSIVLTGKNPVQTDYSHMPTAAIMKEQMDKIIERESNRKQGRQDSNF